MSTRYVDFVLSTGDGHYPKTPAKKYFGDAGWDLYVSRPDVIPPGMSVDVHTDIRMHMPPYVFARIIGRSSTMRKHNLIVSEGIIDNEYTGELFISVHNLSTIDDFVVSVGMRLAQVIFHRIEDIRWAQVEPAQFKEGIRGSSGFGSTGMYDIGGQENANQQG